MEGSVSFQAVTIILLPLPTYRRIDVVGDVVLSVQISLLHKQQRHR